MRKQKEQFVKVLYDEWKDGIYSRLKTLESIDRSLRGVGRYFVQMDEEAIAQSFHYGVLEHATLEDLENVFDKDVFSTADQIADEYLEYKQMEE